MLHIAWQCNGRICMCIYIYICVCVCVSCPCTMHMVHENIARLWTHILHPTGLLPDTQNCGCTCAWNARNVFPHHRLQRELLISDPGMHHGACVTHVPWCMSGSLTRSGGEDVPGIPGAWWPCYKEVRLHVSKMSLLRILFLVISAERLQGVTVKVSHQRPPLQNPLELETAAFRLCGARTSATKAGELVPITCPKSTRGRYVYIYLPRKSYLTMCEVQIYAEGNFKYSWLHRHETINSFMAFCQLLLQSNV